MSPPTLDQEAEVIDSQQTVGNASWMYDTIQRAHDAIPEDEGGLIYLAPSYDSRVEDFPITFSRVGTIQGASRGGTLIESDDPSSAVIRINEGRNEYTETRTIRNVRIKGGETGIKIDPETHAVIQNVIVQDAAENGVAETGNNEFARTSFLNVFRNVDVFDCGNHGFYFDDKSVSHANALYRCTAQGNRGSGADLRGIATHVQGGAYQQNGKHGIRFRQDNNQSIRDVYFEDNGRRSRNGQSFGAGVQVSDSHVVINNCYFYGRDNQNVGVDVRGGNNVQVKNCTFLRHLDGSISVDRDSTDCDLYLQSHESLDETFVLSEDGARTRSYGSVLPTDLSAVEGKYYFDQAFDDGSNTDSGGPELAIWTGEDWKTWSGDRITTE